MLRINIHNETAQLKAVLVGIADDFGGTPRIEDCYDPKSREHIIAGNYPVEKDLIIEIEGLCRVLEKYGVKVYRPENIGGLNQIFTRDIAFVIEDKLVLPNIIFDRVKESEAILGILNIIRNENILKMPENTRAEGGDIMLCNEYIFVGYSEKPDFGKYTVSRTNKAGLDFLADTFPNKTVRGFELKKSDLNPKENALHLDCCFQPIGKDTAILYRGGFKNQEDIDFLISYFGDENIIEITKDEMYNMCSNVFSINENVIISEKGFIRLNSELRKRGFVVEEISYSETAKMEGLLRCSTMPLIRV